MKLFENKNECCGCGVCAEVCSQKAIKMMQDEEGFLYPAIDEDKCINCGLCMKFCAFKTEKNNDGNEPQKAVVAKNINEETRSASQSGGAFSAFSDIVLNENGIVYGVSLDDKFCAIHTRATNEEERNLQRGSKYIQSVLHPVLKQIKEDALNGRTILITGTSCQVASIKKYLEGIPNDKVYYIDIICHGVPSPLIWEKHLNWHVEKRGKLIESINFRDKSLKGWHKHIETINIDKEAIHDSTFINLFYDHYILRPSCYKCPYTKLKRTSDITIGDSWGIDKDKPEMDDNKGTSLILINNEKGEKLFDLSNRLMYTEIIDLSKYIQRPLNSSAKMPYNRKKFWKDFKNKSYEYIVKKYATDEARQKNRIKNKIWGKIKRGKICQ